MARNHRIAVIPGDGIGIEVIEAARKVLEAHAAKSSKYTLTFEEFPWGSAYYKEHGHYLPADGTDQLRKFDAILFGAVGAPDVPDHLSLWGLLLAIRGPMQLFANVRPVNTLLSRHALNPGANFDWVFVRENSEGEYAGHGGRSHVGQDWEIATDTSIYTRHGVRRIMKFAFETAKSRENKHLVVVTKSNALRHGLVLWDEVAQEVSADYPEVRWEKMLVDAMTARMVNKPNTIDTVVGTNLHIDILSDLAAALAGSIGIAPSSNLDPTRACPSMFEPVHGSAFDITGMGIANPVGAVWSACEMMSWLGEKGASDSIMQAMQKCLADGLVTRDMGGSSNTKEVTQAIIERL